MHMHITRPARLTQLLTQPSAPFSIAFLPCCPCFPCSSLPSLRMRVVSLYWPKAPPPPSPRPPNTHTLSFSHTHRSLMYCEDSLAAAMSESSV
jgi:hypothetical protein